MVVCSATTCCVVGVVGVVCFFVSLFAWLVGWLVGWLFSAGNAAGWGGERRRPGGAGRMERGVQFEGHHSESIDTVHVDTRAGSRRRPQVQGVRTLLAFFSICWTESGCSTAPHMDR